MTNSQREAMERQAKKATGESRSILHDDCLYKRDLRAEQNGSKRTAGNWPLKSDAAGVHPDQIPEAVEHSKKIGIPTDFTPDGRAIFTSRGHRQRYCRAIGLRDRNGGYGDP